MLSILLFICKSYLSQLERTQLIEFVHMKSFWNQRSVVYGWQDAGIRGIVNNKARLAFGDENVLSCLLSE